MHPSIVCCYHLWTAHKASGRQHTTVCAISGRSYDSDSVILPKMMQPWSSWAKLSGVYNLRSLDARGLADLREADQILVIAHDAEERDRAASSLGASRDKLLWPDYPPVGTWDNDALREVAHHDFEMGGLNEWDGAAVRHSPVILRRLSRVHCQLEFPSWAFPRGSSDRQVAETSAPLEALDLGCGPISLLRWAMINGSMRVSGVDPLLPMYELVLARHGLDMLEGMKFYRTFACTGEEMDDHAPSEEFDIVYTNNALDHTQDPEKVIRNVTQSLKIGGRLIVGVATREGTRQNWDQFHKTDIWAQGKMLLYCHKDQQPRPLIRDNCGLSINCIVRSDVDALVFEAIRKKTIQQAIPIGSTPKATRY